MSRSTSLSWEDIASVGNKHQNRTLGRDPGSPGPEACCGHRKSILFTARRGSNELFWGEVDRQFIEELTNASGLVSNGIWIMFLLAYLGVHVTRHKPRVLHHLSDCHDAC